MTDWDGSSPDGGCWDEDNTDFSAYSPYPPYPPYLPFAPYPPYPRYCLPAAPPTESGPGEELGEQGADAGGQGTDADGQQPGEGPGGEPPLVFPSTVAVRRPDDLLVCTLRFFGFAFFRDPPRLHRAADDAYIVVEFPPQSFGEEAYLLVSDQSPDKLVPNQNVEVSKNPAYPKQNVVGLDEPVPASLPAARIRMAGQSRVVVAMPADQESVAFDLPSILAAVRDWPMRLSPGAVPDLSPIQLGPRQPADNVTALEMPYRVLMSPLAPATWRHSIPPVTSNGRTELWHTRLANPDEGTQAEPPSRIRAVWSPDYRPPPQLVELYALISVPGSTPPRRNPALIRMSLDPVDRAMLVTVMSGFDAKQDDGRPYVPLASGARRLHLTSVGGLLDAEGSWDPDTLPGGIDLEQWRHLAALGRDQYVRVVYAGWLCPFGHVASLVKVTERRFQPLGSDPRQRLAVLRQRFFLVVRQPVVTYSGANHVHAGHDFPFTQVELLTRVTPTLAEPGFGASSLPSPSGGNLYSDLGLQPRDVFWPMVEENAGMVDFPFHIAATDIGGNRISFAMPLLFVGKPANDLAYTDPSKMAEVKQAYNVAPAGQKRQATIGGANITYAPVDPADQGHTTLPTGKLTFRAGDLVKTANPDFYPQIDRATVGIKPVQKLLAQPEFTTEVSYPDVYAQHGFDAGTNAGEIFLQLVTPKALQFGAQPTQPKSDALGALATPQMNLLGLSKVMGPVSGKDLSSLGNLAGGQFNPIDFFSDATLLGGIKLGEIISSAASLAGPEVPKLLSRDFPDHVEASFDVNTPVTGDAANLLIPNADRSEGDTRLIMSGIVRTALDPSQPSSFQATAELNNFKVNLFGFVILWFEDLRFVSRSGQKPDATVTMRAGEDAVTFGGPLEFVNTLRHYIPSNGFSDPPALVVTPSGLSASYSLNLPAIEVGVFALSNVALGASFSLPFDGTPAVVHFAFSSREHTFSLTVSLLGGGGFFGIGVSSHGVQEIEAALEFGAVVAIDLGVASGSVEVKAGIYFHWLEGTPAGKVDLGGYVRIHGELCVIGLISVALTFNLQLGYEKQDGKSLVYGEAELTVEIDIFMFSTSVSVRCRREFSGGGDPKFIEQIPTQEIWSEYCDAFAVEAA